MAAPRAVRSHLMAAFPTVRVAAIQATPVILDAAATVAKAERLLHEAAAERERSSRCSRRCFIPLYPSNAWAKDAAGFGGWDELWERLWDELGRRPRSAARPAAGGLPRARAFCAIGVNERESQRPGTLYNTLVYLGPHGHSRRATAS